MPGTRPGMTARQNHVSARSVVFIRAMIPFVPIAFAVLALFAWRYDARARRAYEATLSGAEKRQFRALRRVHPSQWRATIALKHAETGIASTQDNAPRPPKKRSRTTAARRNVRKRKAGAKTR
jgi:hypothetical protein